MFPQDDAAKAAIDKRVELKCGTSTEVYLKAVEGALNEAAQVQVHSTFTQHSLNIQSTFTQHSLNIHSTFTQHSLNIHTTSSQHPVGIHSTFTQHSLNIH
jgi:hypothetical protein